MIKNFIFLICLCFFGIANGKTIIVYVNGAFNTNEREVRDNAIIFRDYISNNTGISRENFKFQPILQSDRESVLNASCQNTTSGIAQLGLQSPINYTRDDYEKYYKSIGSQYKSYYALYCPDLLSTASLIDHTNKLYLASKNNLDAGNKIIFIGHSQGSYFIDGAVGLIVRNLGVDALDKIRVVTFGAVSGVNYLNRYINLEQDAMVYGGLAVAYSGAKGSQPANFSGCLSPCQTKATTEEISTKTGGLWSHRFVDYLNNEIYSFENKIFLHKEISKKILLSYMELEKFEYIKNKKPTQIAFTYPVILAKNTSSIFLSWINKTIEFFGISSAFAQSSLFAYINQPYTVRVDGTGFDGNEAVSIDGSTCTASTIQRGSGYFTQSCTGGSAAGDANKIRVYDTQYDLDIEVPTAYQTMQLRGPVIAPLAPALTEPTTGTIRLNWSSVSGATGYEVSRGGVAINTVGTTTSYDDAGRTAGTPYCYRLRTIQGGIMSAYSPEACYTPATIKCFGTWNNTQYSVGATETTTQACQAGYTGNKTLSHTCQASGQWGATTTQDNCTLTPAPTCTGSWSNTKYLIGQTEEKNENTCPAGTQGQVRSWHTCQASGSSAVWGGLSQSDNCTAYLATPTGIYASSVSGGVQITWDGVSGATSYKLYKNGSLYREVSNTSYVDVSVTDGVTYSYSVSAYSNYNGQNVTSPVSGSYSVVYRDGQTGVSPPTNVSAAQYNQYSQKGIRLTWSGAANADSYFVYRRGYSNPYTSATYLAPVGGGDISFTDWVTPGFSGGVITGQSYCYYIRSGRGSVKSTESNEACAMAP